MFEKPQEQLAALKRLKAAVEQEIAQIEEQIAGPKIKEKVGAEWCLMLDPGILDCPANSPVGNSVLTLIEQADAMLAVMADVEERHSHAVRNAVCRQCGVWMFG
jgi:hypothetical protein